MVNILISGASGMVGSALVSALQANHKIAVLGRDERKLSRLFPTLEKFTWDKLSCNDLRNFDTIINLAGENIGAKRWNKAQKQQILQSRVQTTDKIVKLITKLKDKSPRLINASAIGIYGLQKTIQAQQTTVYDEDSPLPAEPQDFLSEVGQAWENATDIAKQTATPLVTLRFAVILAKHDGALAKLLPSFKCGGGAILGSGQQPFSWVSLTDVIRAIEFILQQPKLTGTYNVVADQVVTQAIFAKTLAKLLKRPCFLRMPAKLVQLLFGEMGDELLLNGQSVKSNTLRNIGFHYQYDDLEAALRYELNQPPSKTK